MQTMFILRLLNAQREILAWTKIPGESRGDGALWPLQHFVAEADADGTATDLCTHWVDVNVHTTVPLPQPIAVHQGDIVQVPLKEPLLRIGSDPRPLPGVTVRSSVDIGIAAARG